MRTMSEALQIKQSIEGEWLQKPGVTGIDVGQSGAAPVIRIYVADRQEAMRNLAPPDEIQGVAVEIRERRFHLQ